MEASFEMKNKNKTQGKVINAASFDQQAYCEYVDWLSSLIG